MPSYIEFRYERIDSGIKIIGHNFFYLDSDGIVNIPATIGNLPVKEIGDFAFSERYTQYHTIISVTIPDSVTSIGERAFYCCSLLESIQIPNSVTTIGEEAFAYCKSLRSITIPNLVTRINQQTFFCCTSLTSVVIPDSVTTISNRAFLDCKSLTSITIPDSGIEIWGGAFAGCSSLTSIIIPSLVRNVLITRTAFNGCSSLTNVLIIIRDDTVSILDYPTIHADAFDKHTNITYVRFPKSLMKSVIFKNTLQNCYDDYSKIRYCKFLNNFFDKIRRLKNASNLPDDIHTSVRQIETLVLSNRCTTAVFNGTDSILDDFLTIQELQRKIETNSVINLITLVNGVSQKKITNALKYIQPFNDEIDKIKVAAKENLRALTGEKPAAKRQTAPVTNRPANERQSTPVSNISDTDDKNQKIYEIFQALNKGRTVTSRPRQNPVPGVANSASVQDNLPNEDFSIEYNPVGITIKKYNGSADFVNIPSQINGLSVTTIGDGAFGDCKSLTSIVIPDSVTSIGGNAFWYCKSLASVVIPNSVTSIGGGAFADCKSLASVVIPNSVTIISGSAFYGCKSLTSIVIPDSVTSIGGSVFRKCESLTSVVIPDSVTSIGGSVFYGCKSLTSIVIPDSVTSIGGSVFRKCESLKTIYFPRALMDVNGRDNTLKDFRNEYNDKIRYYNTVSEIKELMESPDFEKENVSNSDFKYTRTRSGIQIDKYVGRDTYVPVPEEIDGLPVTSIGYRAFDNENFYKVIIPASVQTIVYAAFVSKQSMHVLFKGESIQLTPQSFIAPKITFYFYNAIIYDSIYPITKNNPKYVIHYDAMDFRMV